MIEHLLHNDHGEWSFVAMILGSLGVAWAYFHSRVRTWWAYLRGKNLPCEETHRCCEHKYTRTANSAEIGTPMFTQDEMCLIIDAWAKLCCEIALTATEPQSALLTLVELCKEKPLATDVVLLRAGRDAATLRALHTAPWDVPAHIAQEHAGDEAAGESDAQRP